MEPDRSVRRLDATSLRVLAHPLRVRMLGTLRNDGPATATQLARRLGESTGTTSWHLRQLAQHGFIEEDPDRGTRRDRWWRTRTGSTEMAVRDFADRPELLDAVGTYLRGVLDQGFARAAEFVEHGGQWLPDWQDAATFSDFTARLDPGQLEALNAELFAVVDRHRDAAAGEPEREGTETVVIQLQSFPRRLVPPADPKG